MTITTEVLVSLLTLCNMNLACYSEIWFCLLFCMGVILGLSHWGRNICSRWPRIGCWRRCLGVRWTRLQGRRLHNGQLCILNSSPNIIWLIKSMRCMWHVWGTWEMHIGFLEGKRPLGIPRRVWYNNIKYISSISWMGGRGHGLDLSGSWKEQLAGSCECCNETSAFLICREFRD